MKRSPPPAVRSRRSAPLALGAAALLGGCAGGPASSSAPPPLSDAEWRALAAPRPAPLPGAARLSATEIELLGDPAWPAFGAVPARLGLTELVVAGLLRRPDVRVVERRRFAAAVDAERAGARRPSGAPPAGVSPGSELTASVAWVPLGTGGATLEVRLTETATGRVAVTRRALVPADPDPVGLARTVVGNLLAALDELGRRPAWDDPVAGAAPAEYAATGVSSEALAAFLTGLAAEDRWRWEGARIGYQAAAAGAAGFFEAEAALARTARLRLGGTLGES
ncbi:MAG TPA: hypothetical protein VMM35_02130 [Longimicrobiales bacterium]|nr:hypothetical protein [Longimicrobiales bacterium]